MKQIFTTISIIILVLFLSFDVSAQTKKGTAKGTTKATTKATTKGTTKGTTKKYSVNKKTTPQDSTKTQRSAKIEQKKIEPQSVSTTPKENTTKADMNSSLSETTSNKSNFKLNSRLTVTIDIGGTTSFAKGDFVDYHKSFADVTESNTMIKGKINPSYWGVIGLSFRYQTFADRKQLSKLSIISAISYLKTGFTSEVISTYKDPSADYTDELIYKERYSNNYITRQFIIRYGKKFFAELGLVKFNQKGANRTIVLEHEQDGSGAYNGGYSEKQKEKFELDESLLVKKKTNLIVGIGFSMFKNGSLKISEMFTGNTFTSGLNYKNYITQIQLSIPFYNTNIKTK